MENKVLSIEDLRTQANPIVKIPNFDGTGTINVRLKKPRIMDLAQKGEIPNHLIGIATTMITGKSSKKEKEDDMTILKNAAKITELYCSVCLVEPTYEEFKDIMTDDQADYIFQWAMGQVTGLDNFRTDTADDKHDSDVEIVRDETE